MPDLRVDVRHFRLPDKLAKEVQSLPEPIGRKMAHEMRWGKGGVAQQFARQGAITRRGFRAWKPAKRVLRFGGKTLIKTGAYANAWLARGPGSRTVVDQTGTAPGNRGRGPAVVIGVSPTRFPQVRVFQRDRPTRIRARNGRVFTVDPRPIRVNSPMVTAAKGPFVSLLKSQIAALGGSGVFSRRISRPGGVRVGSGGPLSPIPGAG